MPIQRNDQPTAMNEPGIGTGQPAALRIPVRAMSCAIVLAMIAYVAMAVLADREALARQVAAIPAGLWPVLVGLSLLSYLLRFARWQRFMANLGHRIPLLRNLEIYLSAFALTLTPGKAGETIRSVYLHPHGVGYAQSLGAFIAERLLDLAAVGLLAMLAIALVPQHWPWALTALSVCMAAMLLLRTRILSLAAARLAGRGAGKHVADAISAMGMLLSRRILAQALPLSFLAWMAQGISLYLIVNTLAYPLPLPTIVGIYCLSILAGAASFIPGGLGATEAAMALLLAAAGVGRGDAIAAALLSRGVTLWLAVGIGVIAMSRIALLPQSVNHLDAKHAGRPDC
jgi:uncharacterized protein (TIRG00374 family)